MEISKSDIRNIKNDIIKCKSLLEKHNEFNSSELYTYNCSCFKDIGIRFKPIHDYIIDNDAFNLAFEFVGINRWIFYASVNRWKFKDTNLLDLCSLLLDLENWLKEEYFNISKLDIDNYFIKGDLLIHNETKEAYSIDASINSDLKCADNSKSNVDVKDPLKHYIPNDILREAFRDKVKDKTGVAVAIQIAALKKLGEIDFSNQNAVFVCLGIEKGKDGISRYFREGNYKLEESEIESAKSYYERKIKE